MLKIEEIKKEYQKILNQLSDPELISDWEKFEKLSKEKKRLEKIIEKQKEIEETKNKIDENKTILKAKEDSELVSLAESELPDLQEKEKALKKELEEMLKNDGAGSEPNSFLRNKATTKGAAAIIEIRAGTGGDEAALFANNLFKMYSKYADSCGWKQKVLDSRPTELGGLKEIIFELKNGDVFSKIKYEGGVHRVQRIPETEKSGRIHTSTATVAVLVEPKAKEIKIKPDKIKVDYYRSSGPGGQYVNKRETAVRITHLPTGIVVTSQTQRNQLQNKENAMSILVARILKKEKEEEESKIGGKRKAQIGKAERAEKIRTYNFPQDRVTDHRIKKSWHNIENIMGGKLGLIIKALDKGTPQNNLK